MNINLNPNKKNTPERPVDKVIEKNQVSLSNKFRLIGNQQIKIWHALLVIVFVTGAITALVWAGLGDKFIKTSAAPIEVKTQAQGQYQDIQGKSYGPIYSNDVTVPVTP